MINCFQAETKHLMLINEQFINQTCANKIIGNVVAYMNRKKKNLRQQPIIKILSFEMILLLSYFLEAYMEKHFRKMRNLC